MTTLKGMAANNKFHELVFYLEACESGSMFNGLLPNNIHVCPSCLFPLFSFYVCLVYIALYVLRGYISCVSVCVSHLILCLSV